MNKKGLISINGIILVAIALVMLIMLVLIFSGKLPIFKEDLNQTVEQVQIANPASVYCEEQNGTLRTETDEYGEYGVCVFPNGTEIEEWDLFRREVLDK